VTFSKEICGTIKQVPFSSMYRCGVDLITTRQLSDGFFILYG
jgi:hypothetical protein